MFRVIEIELAFGSSSATPESSVPGQALPLSQSPFSHPNEKKQNFHKAVAVELKRERKNECEETLKYKIIKIIK